MLRLLQGKGDTTRQRKISALQVAHDTKLDLVYTKATQYFVGSFDLNTVVLRTLFATAQTVYDVSLTTLIQQ